MSELRILVVEDDKRWREPISESLVSLGDVQACENYEQASQALRESRYDLAIVDWGLSQGADLAGMELLREIRSSALNQYCAVIVVTGNANTERVFRARDEYDVFKVIDKLDAPLLDHNFVSAARSATLKARLKKAAALAATHCCLAISFNESHLLHSALTGLGRQTVRVSAQPQRLDVADLVRRADLLNWMITAGGAGLWREEARSIGNAIYQVVTAARDILGDLKAAQALAQFHDGVWLQFAGPPVGLGIPFELMRDEQGEPLALSHILTRQMVGMSRKPEAFHDFVNDLLKNQERMRVLIIGANSDGRIPATEREAEQLKELIEAELDLLGITHDVRELSGAAADYDGVKQALRDGDYHILHYCGHGHYDEVLAERSGLILRDAAELKVLTANELYGWVRNKKLRLVFLSACTSARTAERAGRGDFHSVFDTLAQADVPVVIGYRWAVADEPALHLATVFYRELWRSFSPGEALLKARQEVAQERGRDDDTWASPVLLMQNV